MRWPWTKNEVINIDIKVHPTEKPEHVPIPTVRKVIHQGDKTRIVHVEGEERNWTGVSHRWCRFERFEFEFATKDAMGRRRWTTCVFKSGSSEFAEALAADILKEYSDD